ncbi:hypothetical protein ACHAW5_002043 [Stephanodiscus triporus]|uniref:ABC transporter domain-containing protein n=1 Tax=Stephanodiscus triporus TaxID=2934178 RepID=A0ABD3QKH1_9STRA
MAQLNSSTYTELPEIAVLPSAARPELNLGTNPGAGKSTFLNALGGTTPRGSGLFLTGSAWYEGSLVADCDRPAAANSSNASAAAAAACRLDRYRLSQREGDVAMLSQHDNFFDMLTPRETLEFAAYLEMLKSRGTTADGKTIEEVAEGKLSSLGLSGVADRRIGDRTALGGGGGGMDGRFFGLNGLTRGLFGTRGGGGLSGGERRRLSVALELITEPRIFLADEPTTGLDSTQAEKVVKLISKLAKERNVPSICTLHQPKASIWRTLDQCILLAPGGKMCYAGCTSNATVYFKHIGYECPNDTNPAEFLIDLVTIDTEDPVQALADEARINVLHHRFLQTCSPDNWPSPIIDGEPIISQQQSITHVRARGRLSSVPYRIRSEFRSMMSAPKRFAVLLLRSWRQNVRNTKVIMIRLAAVMVQAFLFASIFKSVGRGKSVPKSIADRVALLTYGVINLSMMALMKTLDLFARERSVVMREQMRRRYYSLEYILAKVVAEIPLDATFSVVFAAVLKALTGLRTSVATLIKTYCLLTVSSASLGFAIGSFASSVDSAMSTGIFANVILMVVGVINPSGINPDDPPNRTMQLLEYFSPIKWAIESLVTAEFRGMIFDKEDKGLLGQLKDLPKMGALALVQNGDDVLTNLGLGTAKYADLMRQLGILSAFYLMMSWFGLSYFGPSFIDTYVN